jgi:nitrate reductase gamma subunit
MGALTGLRVLTVAAAVFSISAMTWLFVRTLSYGRRPDLSEPAGQAGKGVLYAFGRGMLEKESVALHRLTFAGGIIYHAAIFAALTYLFWVAAFPSAARPVQVFRAVLIPGTAVGLGLLFRRAAKTNLRRLSCPDDFLANLFVDIFLAVTALHTFVPGLESLLLATATLLFVYVPLGKIRHCVFFFYTRLTFGVRFGRRAALPGSSRSVRP